MFWKKKRTKSSKQPEFSIADSIRSCTLCYGDHTANRCGSLSSPEVCDECGHYFQQHYGRCSKKSINDPILPLRKQGTKMTDKVEDEKFYQGGKTILSIKPTDLDKETMKVGRKERFGSIQDSILGKKESIYHPSHYGGRDNPYEVIKVIKAWSLDFHLGNVVKYIARAGKKGNTLEDLEKSLWYLERYVKIVKDERQG